MTAPATTSLRLGGLDLPIVGPRLGDARLHLAAVIITIHVLGQVALEFRVSVVHILAAIGTCFLIEATRTLVLEGRLVWPASAMLTGSGVALILRLHDAEANALWATDGWMIYSAVAGLSLLSKYLIRHRGSHVFNPSNLVLVLTFVVLGSGRVEPLDFWWAPLGPEMVLAYLVILVGGFVIAGRLGLLGMAAAFWLTLAVGLASVSATGHCISAPWALHPVCGGEFWWVVLTSPETFIFLFFMITDPRTVPGSPSGRLLFGIAVAAVSALLMAPQSTEFGAKVGLLAGLVVCSALRPLLGLLVEWREMTLPRLSTAALAEGPAPFVGAVGLVLFVASTAALAGFAGPVDPATDEEVTMLIDPTGVLPAIAPDSLPRVEVDPEVLEFDDSYDSVQAQELAATFVWLLQIEDEAVARRDIELARSVTQGDRRESLFERLELDATDGVEDRSTYVVESLRLVLVRRGQAVARLGFEVRGLRHVETFDGDGVAVEQYEEKVEEVFVLFGPSRGRWFLFDSLPIES